MNNYERFSLKLYKINIFLLISPFFFQVFTSFLISIIIILIIKNYDGTLYIFAGEDKENYVVNPKLYKILLKEIKEKDSSTKIFVNYDLKIAIVWHYKNGKYFSEVLPFYVRATEEPSKILPQNHNFISFENYDSFENNDSYETFSLKNENGFDDIPLETLQNYDFILSDDHISILASFSSQVPSNPLNDLSLLQLIIYTGIVIIFCITISII